MGIHDSDDLEVGTEELDDLELLAEEDGTLNVCVADHECEDVSVTLKLLLLCTLLELDEEETLNVCVADQGPENVLLGDELLERVVPDEEEAGELALMV